jgi:hypothetical protein
MIVGAEDRAEPEGSGGADSAALLNDTEEFLNTFDTQMQEAIKNMDDALQTQLNEGTDITGGR